VPRARPPAAPRERVLRVYALDPSRGARDVAGAPAGPAPRPARPAGFTAGPLRIDYEL
jgi:hypothetical protein